MSRLLLVLFAQLAVVLLAAAEIELSAAMTARIGQRIWRNECGGSVAGLTSWNKGEDFPSLGIGHFIWYPASRRGPFEESFPPLLEFMKRRGIDLPDWLKGTAHCPWTSREAFLADLEGDRLTSLRQLLARTVGLQAEFAAQRARQALPRLLAAASAGRRSELTRKYDSVASVPNGVYALVDYVNFKGEGVNPTERYQGEGWGLLQVLEEMHPAPAGQSAAREFSAAAKRVLARRIANAPRNESQWRAGWFSRCDSYARPF